MPYDNFGQWYHQRHITAQTNEPYRMSAEQFVMNVEEFLYNTTSSRYMDPYFLAWSIAQFDLAKHGSGRVYDYFQYPENQDAFKFQNPPIPTPTKDGLVYHVEYTREDFNNGLVPTSADGTAPLVDDHGVRQVVQSPDNSTQDALDHLYQLLEPQIHEDK